MNCDFVVLDTSDNPDIYAPHAHVLLGDVHRILKTTEPNTTVLQQILYRVTGESRSEFVQAKRRGTLFATKWALGHGLVLKATPISTLVVVHQIDGEKY